MWQVAAHDNREMKETMRKSLRKLREHETFRHAEQGDEEYLLTCTEDE